MLRWPFRPSSALLGAASLGLTSAVVLDHPVVVVGGTGFYGRYLVSDLLQRTTADVVVVARREPISQRLVYQVYEMADLDVLPDLYDAGTVSFKAGCEFATVNRLLGVIATIRARTGQPKRPERWTTAGRWPDPRSACRDPGRRAPGRPAGCTWRHQRGALAVG